jgi:hypothetical protein
MVGPQGVAANFTPIPANVPVSALPISETVAAPGAATYAVAVTSVAGLSGTVTLAVSGLPQGATATFSPQTLGATGTSSLTVSVGAASPVGTYPLTITASNGSIAPTTMAFLTIVAPSPANMISPATGSNLSAGPTTFAWDSGMGVSQFQLVLGSTPGGSDLFTGSAGTSQSATVTLPASSQQEHAALSPTSSSMRFLGDYDSAMLEKDGSSPKNASGSFTWYAATSCTFDPNTGDTLISHTFDPAGDNQAGKGTTLTTYNLQPPQQ